MVDSVVRRRHEHVLKPTEFADVLSVHPKLIDQVECTHGNHHLARHTDKKEGGVENPSE